MKFTQFLPKITIFAYFWKVGLWYSCRVKKAVYVRALDFFVIFSENSVFWKTIAPRPPRVFEMRLKNDLDKATHAENEKWPFGMTNFHIPSEKNISFYFFVKIVIFQEKKWKFRHRQLSPIFQFDSNFWFCQKMTIFR